MHARHRRRRLSESGQGALSRDCAHSPDRHADLITEAVNNGWIYKFITKPWEAAELRQQLREAFAHYEKATRLLPAKPTERHDVPERRPVPLCGA